MTELSAKALNTQSCGSCRFVQTAIILPRGSELKQLIVTCEKEHAPIWLFSGGDCEDYQEKESEK